MTTKAITSLIHPPLLLLAMVLVGCTGPKTLDTSVGLRKAESMSAVAVKQEADWKVSLPLPEGRWKVAPFEEQIVDIQEGTPNATMVWKVTPQRWSNYGKPFIFDLIGEDNARITMTVRYKVPKDHSTLSRIGQELVYLAANICGNPDVRTPVDAKNSSKDGVLIGNTVSIKQ